MTSRSRGVNLTGPLGVEGAGVVESAMMEKDQDGFLLKVLSNCRGGRDEGSGRFGGWRWEKESRPQTRQLRIFIGRSETSTQRVTLACWK